MNFVVLYGFPSRSCTLLFWHSEYDISSCVIDSLRKCSLELECRIFHFGSWWWWSSSWIEYFGFPLIPGAHLFCHSVTVTSTEEEWHCELRSRSRRMLYLPRSWIHVSSDSFIQQYYNIFFSLCYKLQHNRTEWQKNTCHLNMKIQFLRPPATSHSFNCILIKFPNVEKNKRNLNKLTWHYEFCNDNCLRYFRMNCN